MAGAIAYAPYGFSFVEALDIHGGGVWLPILDNGFSVKGIGGAGTWRGVQNAWVKNSAGVWVPFWTTPDITAVTAGIGAAGTSCVVANQATGTVSWTPNAFVRDTVHNVVVNIYLSPGNGLECNTYTQANPASSPSLAVTLWLYANPAGTSHTVYWDWALTRVSDGAILDSGGYSGGLPVGGLTYTTVAKSTSCC